MEFDQQILKISLNTCIGNMLREEEINCVAIVLAALKKKLNKMQMDEGVVKKKKFIQEIFINTL